MMELNLNRVDYTQVGVTSQKTMKLLPLSGKTQKIVIADNNGVVQCFGLKKGEIVHAFKTLPSQKINRLLLGGAPGSTKDRIFVCTASEVQGFSKKGKQFLTFSTNISEAIHSMYVENADLFICGRYTFNHFRDCKDTHHFLCSEKINDVICLPQDKEPEITPILACQDRMLRVIEGSDLLYEIEVAGTPSVLQFFNGDGGLEGNELLYGTVDGRVGLVEIGRTSPAHKWELQNQKKNGGVTSLDNFDILSDGVLDLLVGREDGEVEIYSYDEAGEPVLRYSHSCSESITSVEGGVVGSAGYPEIVCATYAGWVFGLTSDPQMNSVGPDDLMDQKSKIKISSLKQELEEIQQKVVQEREKYQNSTLKDDNISVMPVFDIKDKFYLNKDDAAYLLSFELQVPIDNVLIQSDVQVHIIDGEKNSSVVSFSACNPEDGNFVLVTFRCQANTTRLEVKIRTVEGQYGVLQAYITPRIQPKTCQLRQYQIKPLSLHQRTHSFDPNRPYNFLKLSGQFSLAEAHSWLTTCLPELPDRPPASQTNTYHFVSSFLDTMLECKSSKGQLTIRSENVSTISILKDVLTKEAIKKKIHLDITYDIHEQSVPYTLSLIHPKLEYQLQLAKKVHLLDALKELEVHEKDLNFMSPEYREILCNADAIQKEYMEQPFHLDRLYGMITDLYIDTNKFQGRNAKSKVPALLELLASYDLSTLVKFFDSSLL